MIVVIGTSGHRKIHDEKALQEAEKTSLGRLITSGALWGKVRKVNHPHLGPFPHTKNCPASQVTQVLNIMPGIQELKDLFIIT